MAMPDAIHLQRLEITGHSPGPRLLVFGGVHGDEFEPMAAIRRLMRQLDPATLRGTVTAVPVVNEPAFLRGARTAEDGLDLARTFPGRADGTITERIAHAANALICQADYFIDLHTGGTQFRILPLTGYGLHADARLLDAQRRMARAFNLPIVWGTDGRLNGRSLSAARDAGVPAIYAEYHGSATCDPAGVEAYVTGCLNVMAELGMLDRPRPDSAVEHFVEDDRPGAGHLQICNRSPLTGFFEPAVRLGDRVQPGDALGTVCDELGQRVETVRATQSGLVLLLTTFSRVKEGDSLAVILESGDSGKQ
jgi:predicted deacylase